MKKQPGRVLPWDVGHGEVGMWITVSADTNAKFRTVCSDSAITARLWRRGPFSSYSSLIRMPRPMAAALANPLWVRAADSLSWRIRSPGPPALPDPRRGHRPTGAVEGMADKMPGMFNPLAGRCGRNHLAGVGKSAPETSMVSLTSGRCEKGITPPAPVREGQPDAILHRHGRAHNPLRVPHRRGVRCPAHVNAASSPPDVLCMSGAGHQYVLEVAGWRPARFGSFCSGRGRRRGYPEFPPGIHSALEGKIRVSKNGRISGVCAANLENQLILAFLLETWEFHSRVFLQKNGEIMEKFRNCRISEFDSGEKNGIIFGAPEFF